MKALILEDELLIANYLKKVLIRKGITDVILTSNIKEAKDGLNEKPDFCVLDIRIGNDITSLDFARNLSQLSIPFFFITANDEKSTITEAVSTNPVGYISKPFKENDVQAILELIKIKIVDEKEVEILCAKGKIKVLQNQILYCQADGVYTKIYTQEEGYIQRITLKEFLQKLSPETFDRVHKSFVVNKKKASRYNKDSLIINNKIIPLSRSYKGL